LEKINTRPEKIWIAFGIITVLCGIGLAFSDQIMIGISGAIVGMGLTWQNIQKLKSKNAV